MDKSRKKLSLKEKISYGFGGFVDQIMANSFGQLAFPIYNIALGLDAKLLGIALAVPRFVDAVTDPMMGHISDNTRSRWGRRKPYIAIGSILMALSLVLVFSPPASLGDRGLFLYILIMGALMYVAYTIFAVPYQALGFELTDDYHERTSVQVWRMVMISAKALVAPWLLKACFVIGKWLPASERPVEVRGVFFVAIGLGLLVVLGTIPILIFCHENAEHMKKAKVAAFASIKSTLSNKVFRVHLITIFMVMIGAFIYGPLTLYINNYYVFGGDKDAAATLVGYSGSMMAICGFLAIPVISWLSRRIGKKATYAGGIIVCGLMYPLSWFLFNPNMPYLQLVLPVITCPALTCCWVLNPSITADICDHDELKTGQRREGMYGAVWGFSFKCGLSAISLVMGLLIAWTGFIADAAAQTPETILRIRLLMVVIPLVFLAGGGIFFAWRFPLTRARMQEIQDELKERHTAAESLELE
ncbi:MAG: MFS transporter [Lentisphaeria bacterium]|nr:MFS transporter [Lentisphaeria bacterium]